MRLIICSFVVLTGCSGQAPTPPVSSAPVTVVQAPVGEPGIPIEPVPSDTLELFDRTWTRTTNPVQHTHFGVTDSWLYECDTPSLRLVFLTLERQIAKSTIVYVETSLGGQEWMNHGTELRWDHDRDGTQVVFESPYSMGELNGTARVWRDGKLAFRREYQMGKQHGLSEGWYSNGQKQYESVYEFGKEVSAKLWREDGTPNK